MPRLRRPSRAAFPFPGLLLILLAAPLLLDPTSVPAQEAPALEGADRRWFPDTTAFMPLLAAPREAALRGGLVLADRPGLDDGRLAAEEDPAPFVDGDFAGRNLEAEVALGLQVPVFLLRRESPSGPSMVLEFELGTFSRFFMESRQFDLINVDYRVGLPVTAGWRGWEGRLGLRHVSSHLGDDFIRRFGVGERQVSLDGVELLVARWIGELARGYLGGEANFHANPDVERTAVVGGLEVDPGRRDGGEAAVWPYAATHFRLTNVTGRLEGMGVAGVATRVRGVGLRLEGRGHFGPSPMGWLRTVKETFWGIGLRVEP